MNCYYGTQIALEHINAAGGINGKELEAEFLDTAGNLTEGMELAKRFVDDPEVMAILGPIRGVEAVSICPVTNEAGMVTFCPITSQNDLGEIGPYVWVGCCEQRYEQPEACKLISSLADNCVIMYKNTEWGVNSLDGFMGAIDEYGVEVLAAEPYAETETDFTTTLTKLREYDADLIYLISEIADGSIILSQMYQLGWTDIIKFGSGSMNNVQVVENAGAGAAEGMYSCASIFIPEDHPFYVEFMEVAGFPPAVQGLLAYNSTLGLAHALEIADNNGNLTRKGIADAFTEFGTLENFNGIELLAPLAFRENQTAYMDFQLVQIVDGSFQEVN